MASGRTVRATLPGAERGRAARRTGRRLGRGPRRHGSVARQRLRRRRPAPADPDRRARSRDHRAEPRGRVHRPDRRRRPRRPRTETRDERHDQPAAPDLAGRRARVPPLGGFNLQYVRLEIRRLLRNKRTLIFTVALPPFFYLIFGAGQNYANDSAGHGNVAAFVMISMAIYGAMLATTSGGAMVSIERAAGWSRQLRLTPLSPVAVHRDQADHGDGARRDPGRSSSSSLGRAHGAQMDGHLWFETAAIAWLGSIVFAAFGLFMGYLLPSENVMQILGPVLALLAFAGGLFIPLSQMDHTFRQIARVHADVRPQRAGPRPAHRRRGAPGLGREPAGLAGDLRRRRDLAVPQGHGAGLSMPLRPPAEPTSRVFDVSKLVPRRTGGPSTRRRPGVGDEAREERSRWGWIFGAVWLFYLADPISAIHDHGPGPVQVTGLRRDRAVRAWPTSASSSGPGATGRRV